MVREGKARFPSLGKEFFWLVSREAVTCLYRKRPSGHASKHASGHGPRWEPRGRSVPLPLYI